MNIFSTNVKNIKSFKSLLSILKDLMIDLTLIITKESINITSFDESKNVLVHIELLSENFNDYVCLVEKLIVTTGSQNFYKIISKISNKSTLNMCIKNEDYQDSNVQFFTLVVDNTFIKLKLNENPNEFEPPLIMEKHKTRFLMRSEDIFYVVKNMEIISENIEIKVQINQITFTSVGQYAESQVSFGNHSRSIEMDKITIPISILKSFTKSVNLSDQLIIQFGHGIPFSISYKKNDLGKLSFYYKNCQSI